MSTRSENHNSSTTAPPANVGNGNATSEHSSALTVELSPSTASGSSEGKTSVLTTGPVGSDFVLSGSAITIATDATVIRSDNTPQESSGSHSSNVSSLSAHKSSNENVEFVNNASSAFDYDLTNKVFGIYHVQKKIGGGGMGDVYLAKDTLLDRDVALKVLTPNQQSGEFRERFIIEAKTSAKLHHDNIVTVYSFGEINGRIYLAMEYIPGINLRVKEKNGPLSIEETLSYAIQLSAALEHIHQKGIVHRDIKPSNVIIMDDGTAKIIDLGLAKDIGLKKNNESETDLTQTGVTLGTFDYISPEQARDSRNVDIRSDIYSLGCTMFFMLTASPPYPEGNGLQKLLSHQGDTPPNVQDERSDVPDSLADIIMRCMSKKPELRYQTPQELTKALYIAAEERGMRPSELSMTKWYFPVRSRLKVWSDRLAWAVPIVFLFIGVIALDYIWRPTQRQSEFLPETPGLKRNIVSIKSGGRGSSIFGLPVKRGKVLEVDDVPQPFPQPPEISPTENELTPPVSSETSNAPADNNPNSALQPVPPTLETETPNNNPQINDSNVPAATSLNRRFPEKPNASAERKAIHSVKLETD